jgi:hypothetical protein
MESFPFEPDDWMIHKLSHCNIKINQTTFPIESKEAGSSALNTILALAVSIAQEDIRAFAAYSAFNQFPKTITTLTLSLVERQARSSSDREEKQDVA